MCFCKSNLQLLKSSVPRKSEKTPIVFNNRLLNKLIFKYVVDILSFNSKSKLFRWDELVNSPALLAGNNYLKLLKRYHQEENQSSDSMAKVLENAIRGGSMEMFQYLLDHYRMDQRAKLPKAFVVQKLMIDSSVYRRVDFVHYLLQRYQEFAWSYGTMMLHVPYSGDIEQLKFFSDRFKSNDINYMIFEKAASAGQVEMIKWLATNRSKGIEKSNMFTIAADNGHFELVKFLYENGGRGYLPGDSAAKYTLEMVKWFNNTKGSYFTNMAMTNAAENGKLDIVIWLNENRTEQCLPNTVNLSANNGHLEVVKWFYENRTERFSGDIFEIVKNGYFDLLKYLYAQHCSGGGDGNKLHFVEQPTVGAARSGHIDILKWLYENGMDGGGGSGTEELSLSAAIFQSQIEVAEWLIKNKEINFEKLPYKNSHGQLGTNLTDGDHNKLVYDQDNFTPVPTLYKGEVRYISTGVLHSGIINTNGELFTFGSGSFFKLGIGNSEDYKIPQIVHVAPGHKVSMVACANEHTLALANGKIYSWVKVANLSVGDRHMGAVDTDGWIYTWGSNGELQLGMDGGDKNTPTMNTKLRCEIQQIECGGTFTAVISKDDDNNSLYVFGQFANIHVSSTPKKFMTGVESVSCSHDCSNNLLAIKKNGEVWSAGWSRYGQAGTVDEVAQFGKLASIIAKPVMVACGAYHSAMLFTDPVEIAFQLVWSNHLEMAYNVASKYYDKVLLHSNSDGDSFLHIIAKKRIQQQPEVFKLFTLINKLNGAGRPPFFYNGSLLKWYKLNMPDIYFRDREGQTCLHYYCKNNMYDDIPHILSYSAFDERVRDSEMKRAFEYIPKDIAFKLKKRFDIADIGIIYHKQNKSLAERIKKSIEETQITCELIHDTDNVKKRCIGYVFLVSKVSLETEFTRDLLVNVLVKSPMISIWAEKLAIKDPTLESCIYRSQLVDFSQEGLYHDSLSTLLEGIDNLMQFIPKEQAEAEESDLKVDSEFVKISGEESIYISYDTSKQQQYSALFKFLEQQKITVVSKEQGLLSSWVVVVIINSKDFSAQTRDEISLAENRNKPVIPIYYEEGSLDQGSIYTFANSPKLRFDDESFHQLLTLIKLNYHYLHNSSKLFNLLKQ
ncbi:regulator of chromosome condensation domain-containing protein [Heterostelium album PN500]|uniref:Regulator of chromosome condensation domain-containing protein n=1 Tax=Heterostelium pallidum (strain ATCC 26659 / Pp 5 / PN500) TaxID=670386 RepID=D3B218_HETP5|nr:regulator of chromosome condensation domain-containing protein [Heterostelium album PN500]EFA85342.1 regulator of chromosome condensation domain-containing protein [Heterostelium album PN500]|eukprot:XP_020437451.1 regulator of chromosome condensation domain-containing protein [Heterostelium album PN500]